MSKKKAKEKNLPRGARVMLLDASKSHDVPVGWWGTTIWGRPQKIKDLKLSGYNWGWSYRPILANEQHILFVSKAGRKPRLLLDGELIFLKPRRRIHIPEWYETCKICEVLDIDD